MKRLNLLIAALILSVAGRCMPSITNVVILQNQGVYDKVELGIELINFPSWANPYDPNDINMFVEFSHTGPSGTHTYTVNAFYYKDFNIGTSPHPMGFPPYDATPIADAEFLTTVATPYTWRCRFAPPESGVWTYRVKAIFNPNITVAFALYGWDVPISFNVFDTDSKGYLQRDANRKYTGSFKFSDGTHFFPTGTNIPCYEYPYHSDSWAFIKQTLDNIQEAKGNFARVLMCGDQWHANSLPNTSPYSNGFMFNIEWDDNPALIVASGSWTPLGNYDGRQNIAFLLDQLVDEAAARDIYLQLAQFSYADVEFYWDYNPYHQLFAYANRNDFYSDPQALDYYKRKLRYIAARWGYSTHVFSWEVGAEVSNMPSNIIASWIDDVAVTMKGFDPNHMTTASGYYGSNTPNIDYLDDHAYTNTESYNFIEHKSAKNLQNITSYSMPLMEGEFGYEGCQGDNLDLKNFDKRSMYNRGEFHNTIWSSSFSGNAGTSSYFWGQIFPGFWTGSRAYMQIKPLRIMIDDMDMENNAFVPIFSKCATPTASQLNMSSAALSYFQTPCTGGPNGGGYNTSFAGCPTVPNGYNDDITVYLPSGSSMQEDNSQVRMVAVKSIDGDGSLFGWVHKKDNFWWKLPHLGSTNMNSSYFDENCVVINGVIPSSSACNNLSLENAVAHIDNVCNGEYYIDYYSAYPGRSVVSNGPQVDGGIIPDFTRRLFTSNNALSVKIPRLEPLSDPTVPSDPSSPTSIYAPDYGFRIRKVDAENFQNIEVKQPGQNYVWIQDHKLATYYRLGPYVTKVFFKGVDDLLHYYYYDPSTDSWMGGGGTMNGGVTTHPLVTGNIATENYDETKVFFRGTSGKPYYYYYLPTAGSVPAHWDYGCIDCSSASYSTIEPESDIEATPTQVFYRTQDKMLHMYDFSGGTWSHAQLGTTPSSTSEQVEDIETLDDYSGTSADYVFIVNHDNGIVYYQRSSNPLSWTLQTIPMPTVNDQLVSKNICVTEFNGAVHIFYIGRDGYPQCFYTPASSLSGSPTWTHAYLGPKDVVSQALGVDVNNGSYNSNTNLHFQDGILYYLGNDGYMHRYYWDAAEWRHSIIVACAGQKIENVPTNINWKPVSGVGFVYEAGFQIMKEQKNLHSCEDCRDGTLPVTLSSRRNDGSAANAITILGHEADRKFDIRIYPNPASDLVNIEFKDLRLNGSISLMNSLGMVVKKQAVYEGSSACQLPVGELPRGLYYISVYDGQGKLITVQKVTLQ